MKPSLALILALLAGCAAPPKTWYKTDSTEQDFNKESNQCRAQAYSIPGAPAIQQTMVFEACMQGKGWTPGAAQ